MWGWSAWPEELVIVPVNPVRSPVPESLTTAPWTSAVVPSKVPVQLRVNDPRRPPISVSICMIDTYSLV